MFWDKLSNFNENVALIDADSKYIFKYREVDELSNQLLVNIKSGRKELAFLFCSNNYKSIISYITLLRSGYAQLLVDKKTSVELKNELIKIYQPEIILSDIEESFQEYNCRNIDLGLFLYERRHKVEKELNKDLGLLLSTSGTTGSPKLVRLSYNNLQSNATSICKYLKITEKEKAITSLPMSYSYGLSVINSHLQMGATIVLTNQSFVMRDFWNLFNANGCTSFAGVPYSFQLLKKVHFNKIDLPTLKIVTQAGGRLSEEYISYFYEQSEVKSFKFFVMYGQTEATARISYVPYEYLREKKGSVGIAIPDGEIKIMKDGKEILEPGIEGELVYYGRNVMLGYADSRDCLNKKDELNGVLHTGDIAYKDKDGFLFITGRMKRFIKIFGLRINLDEVEKMIENYLNCPAACFGKDDLMTILVQIDQKEIEKTVIQKVVQLYKLNTSVIRVKRTDKILTTLQGKKDYKRMELTNIDDL